MRSFVAVDVEAAVRERLEQLLGEFARLQAEVRWVRTAGLHLTLKFLGAVEESRLVRVRDAVAAAVAEQACMRLRVRGLGAFPSLRRPRVLWVGCGDAGALGEMARRVDAALTPLGFEAEARAFTPHVTLGRVKGLRGWPALEAVFKSHLDDDFGDSVVDAVTVYRSTLQPQAAKYTPLWTIPLRGHREGAR